MNDRTRLITRLCWVVAFTLVLTHIVLAWLVRSPAITTGNDDALYLLLARSLRSLNYLNSHIVGSPVHAQYPPGYPAFLALFGENFQAALLGGILVSAIGLTLTYDMAREVIGPVPALLVLAVLALNPALVDYAGSARSEALFMAVGVGAIWCASRVPGTRKWLIAAGAFAIYAAMVRTAGVALVAAFTLIWLLQRRFRPALVFAAASALIVGGWLVWTMLAPEQFEDRSYAAAFQRAQSAPTVVGVMVNRIEASSAYLYRRIPSALSFPTIEGTLVDNVGWALLVGVGLIAGLYALWRRFPLVTGYLLLYGLLLTVYPFKLTRFVVPLVPLLLMTIAAGLILIVRRLTGRGSFTVAAILCLPLIANGVRLGLDTLEQARGCLHSDPRTPPTCYRDDQRSFFAAAHYAKTQTPPGAVFLTLKEATFAYLSGRKVQHPELAIMKDSLNLPETLRRDRVDYVLITPLHRSRLGPLLLRRCTDFRLDQSFPPATYLFKVLPVADSTPGPACEALERVAGDRRFGPLDPPTGIP